MFFSNAWSDLLNSFPSYLLPCLHSASVYSPPPLLCCWVLTPCYILFTLIKTSAFNGTQSAWDSLTHLTMVTVQSPVYIFTLTALCHFTPLKVTGGGRRGEERADIRLTPWALHLDSDTSHQRYTKGHHTTIVQLLPVCQWCDLFVKS